MQSYTLRDSVDAPAPEWIAAQYAPAGEARASDRPVHPDCVLREVTATRVKPALPAERSGEDPAIDMDQRYQRTPDWPAHAPDHLANTHGRSFPLKSSVISSTRSWLFAPTMGARATRTASRPRAACAACCQAARSTRRARFRCTAPPTRLPAIAATRSGPGVRNSMTRSPRTGRTVSRIPLISRERTPQAVSAGQTVKRARPLRRRAARIERPARVRMR